MQSRIALCMIVKPGEMSQAKLAIESVIEHVNRVYVTMTGKPTDEDLKTDLSHIEKIESSQFEWIDDFSAARSFNFSQANEEWILWLDADDTLQGAEQLRRIVDLADSQDYKGFFVFYEYNHDENGNCIDLHRKMQLVRNDGHFEWKGAIHEDILQKRAVKWARTNDIRRIHHMTKEKTEESYQRNLKILLKERERMENNPDPRVLFYLGRTYVSVGDYQNAIESLTEYLKLSGWDEERYEATIIMGQCFFNNGQIKEALEYYNSAVIEKEEYPDAYIQKGMAYMKLEEYKKALVCFETALTRQLPEGTTYMNPMVYNRDIFGAMASACLYTGQMERAEQLVMKALKADPIHKKMNELSGIIQGVRRKIDNCKRYVEIVKYLQDRKEEHKVLPLLSSIPNEIADNPLILKLKFDYLKPKTWSEKSLAVYCPNTAEPFIPSDVDGKGIGGSETAVVEITKRLAKMGWDVTVYNSCQAPPEGFVFDGVRYENFWKFNWNDVFNVLWVWRAPELFDLGLSAKLKILDLHDVMNPLDFTPERIEKIDKIFVKSNYHRSLLPEIPDEKFTIIGNGINLEKFSEDGGAEPRSWNRFVYASTPDRGLDILVEFIWPLIKREIPEAELHVYYGWNTFAKLCKDNPERMMWMERVRKNMQRDDIIDHGRIGQRELAREEMKSNLWLYPTYFPEIHCITACEMQAAGVIPIHSNFAALAETIKSGIAVEGDVYDPAYHKKFVEQIVLLLKDKGRQEELRNNAIEAARSFSWDEVAAQWNNQFEYAIREEK